MEKSLIQTTPTFKHSGYNIPPLYSHALISTDSISAVYCGPKKMGKLKK
jgi:hypothetical protein